jgi:hypothetical protein
MYTSECQRIESPYKVEMYTQDIKVKRDCHSNGNIYGKRKSIKLFSKAARRRLLFVARNSGHFIKSQLCLTYHCSEPENGKEMKKQLNLFLTLLRGKYKDVKYLWVLEFQKRGTPHFHCFLNIPHTDDDFREWAAISWNRIIGDSEQNLKFQRHKRNFIEWKMDSGKYLVKEYLAKCDQKHVPEEFHSVGRFWGNSRSLIPRETTIIPEKDCSLEAFKKAIRIISKRREKIIKSYVKRNYRNLITSYSLPRMTDNFIRCLQYYNKETNFHG